MKTVSTSRRLLILSCSMTKRPGPKWMPARDRYDGPLWRTLRHVDPGEQKGASPFCRRTTAFAMPTWTSSNTRRG